MHFWVSATRGGFHAGFCWPRKIGTNWFMPALVKSKLGASGKSDDDGTMVCCFSRKKSRNDFRISLEVMTWGIKRDIARDARISAISRVEADAQNLMRGISRAGKCGSEFAQIVFVHFGNGPVIHPRRSPVQDVVAALRFDRSDRLGGAAGGPDKKIDEVFSPLVHQRGYTAATDVFHTSAHEREFMPGKIFHWRREIEVPFEPRTHGVLIERNDIRKMRSEKRPNGTVCNLGEQRLI